MNIRFPFKSNFTLSPSSVSSLRTLFPLIAELISQESRNSLGSSSYLGQQPSSRAFVCACIPRRFPQQSPGSMLRWVLKCSLNVNDLKQWTAIKKKAQISTSTTNPTFPYTAWTEHVAITPTWLAAALPSFCVCETHFISSMTMKLEDIQNVYRF